MSGFQCHFCTELLGMHSSHSRKSPEAEDLGIVSRSIDCRCSGPNWMGAELVQASSQGFQVRNKHFRSDLFVWRLGRLSLEYLAILRWLRSLFESAIQSHIPPIHDFHLNRRRQDSLMAARTTLSGSDAGASNASMVPKYALRSSATRFLGPFLICQNFAAICVRIGPT